MAAPRVGILGFLHESNTFLGVPTRWEDFASTSMTSGDALRHRWSGARHELGGFFDGCAAAGLEPVPGFATFAVPSGAIAAADFERIAAALLAAFQSMGPLDGLLVALHGATVAESHRDADGEILLRLRALAGPSLPIVVTLDLHANISPQMVDNCNAIVAYRTNPHLDQRERGEEAALLLARAIRGDARPVMALASPPLAVPIAAQTTENLFLFDDLRQVLTWPGILSASVALGFYYADVEEMGTSFLAVADHDQALAARAAQWLAGRAWARRHELVTVLPSPAEAVAAAIAAPAKPVALMDVGDNVGGGSPADSLVLFEECLRQGARNALVVLYSPAHVDRCRAAGVGNSVALGFCSGRVKLLSDGLFTERKVRHGGWTHCDQGLTAVVETPENHTVVLTSRRMAPMSLEQIRSAGVIPETKDILIVKGVIAPQAAYREVAASIVLVDTPGPTANDPASFHYLHRRRPMFPLEPHA
ncbi:MAG: M81 family metallopeptidase [Bryobacterales bacterium]|nr:M81 family metallopeptidase [Bryobacterales bacterium]